MTQASLFDGSAAQAGMAEFLNRVGRREVAPSASSREQAISIAHGLAYDPHVDGKLRLTPTGRERLTA